MPLTTMARLPDDRDGAVLGARNSDVDFADVFGGPPRRSSVHEHLRGGRSRADSLDSSCALSPSAAAARRSAEKPVFGERTCSDRRRQLGDGFFSDIFPGSESPWSTPRRADRDVFAPPSPWSMRLSTSISMKFIKGTDDSPFTSPSQHEVNKNDDAASYAHSVPSSPNSFVPSFPSRASPSLDDGRKSPFSLYRLTSLSRLRSHSGDKKEATHYASSVESEYQRPPTKLEGYVTSNQFHFSFYKWAGKGVSLMLPTTSEEKGEKTMGLRGFPKVVMNGIDLIDDEDNMSTATGASKSQSDYEDYKSSKDIFLDRKHNVNPTSMEGVVPVEFGNYTESDKTEEPGARNSKTKLKNLHQLFKEGNEELGIKTFAGDVKSKQQADNDGSNIQAVSPSIGNSQATSEDKLRGRRVKGKVKEFIKIFNTEGSPKRKGTSEAQDQRSSGKDKNKSGVQDTVSVFSSEANEDGKVAKMSNESAFLGVSSPISEIQEKTEKPGFNMNSEMETINATFSERKEAINASSDTTCNAVNDKMSNAVDGDECHVEDIEGCLIEHFSEDQYSILHNEEQNQIKISESKIREWSKGKEGNIRSLLSTLQYILWPESGWKPVPLADIIEGAAVKKAYQKALLCLHPDKLQQRGAAMHQKYIAEKVFDILQEAWTEFNSVAVFG